MALPADDLGAGAGTDRETLRCGVVALGGVVGLGRAGVVLGALGAGSTCTMWSRGGAVEVGGATEEVGDTSPEDVLGGDAAAAGEDPSCR